MITRQTAAHIFIPWSTLALQSGPNPRISGRASKPERRLGRFVVAQDYSTIVPPTARHAWPPRQPHRKSLLAAHANALAFPGLVHYSAQLRLFFWRFIITSARWSPRSAERPFSPHEQDPVPAAVGTWQRLDLVLFKPPGWPGWTTLKTAKASAIISPFRLCFSSSL